MMTGVHVEGSKPKVLLGALTDGEKVAINTVYNEFLRTYADACPWVPTIADLNFADLNFADHDVPIYSGARGRTLTEAEYGVVMQYIDDAMAIADDDGTREQVVEKLKELGSFLQTLEI